VATLKERLKQLGIGVKAPERKPEQVPEGFRTFTGKQNLDTEKLLNINGKTYIGPKFPRAEQPAEMRSRFPIPGTQALSGMGLFTQRDATGTVLSAADQARLEAMGQRAEEDMARQNDNARGGFEGTGELTDGTTIYTGEERQSNGFNPVTTSIDLLQGAMQRGDVRAGAAELGKTGEFAEGTTINTTGVDLRQDPIRNAINTLVQTAKQKAQSVKDFAEQQKQDYLDNRNKRMQQRASTMLMDMEYQLMQKIAERDQLQKDTFELMNLEKQVGEANNQMDQTNYVLRNSGLFGQGMRGPSYSNPMQPTMSETYAQPEYYSDPFEIKRLYE
jgi:hypothetical protein